MLSDEQIDELWRSHEKQWPELGKRLINLNVFARAIEAAVLAELAKQEPAWWHYVVNGEWDNFTKVRPPEDAYDEGTLRPLYAAPVVPDGYVMVPQSAFDWLMGLGDDFEPDRKGVYWWRSKFREMIDAAEKESPKLVQPDDIKDAMRYRWLRDIHSHHYTVTRYVGGAVIPRLEGEELDAAIDAAMKAQK